MSENNNSNGITFTGLLQAALLVLKLGGWWTAPWWVVLLPTLASLGLVALVLVFAGIAWALSV